MKGEKQQKEAICCGLLFFQSVSGITVLRVPEHPAIGAEFFRCVDLLPYFLSSKMSFVKGVIPECLNPGPETDWVDACPFLPLFQCQVNNFMGSAQREAGSREFRIGTLTDRASDSDSR